MLLRLCLQVLLHMLAGLTNKSFSPPKGARADLTRTGWIDELATLKTSLGV